MNYANEQHAQAGSAVGCYPDKIMSAKDEMTLTPRQNIANRIASLKAQIEHLQATEKSLIETGLLDVPIMQLRQAMQF